MDSTLSIVPSEGSNDFPVLKAFQEYIDAEQAKARKRMLGLSVFFIILLVVVVVTFVLILTTVVNRNQALSDRLLVPQQTVIQPHVSTASVQDMIKPIIERLEREQASMKTAYEQQQKEAKAIADARDRERVAELEKARKELQKERARAKKEADAQAAKERHLRRLYPEYYSQRDEAQYPSPAAQPQPSQQRQTLRETQPSAGVRSQASEQKPNAKIPDLKPVTYFNSDDDDEVPFLLETPKKSQ